MTTNAQSTSGTPTADFESALRTLVLESYANGAAVEGTWDIGTPTTVVPNWRITIEKTEGADPPADESAFLDE